MYSSIWRAYSRMGFRCVAVNPTEVTCGADDGEARRALKTLAGEEEQEREAGVIDESLGDGISSCCA